MSARAKSQQFEGENPAGFSRGLRFTPVPSPLLGPLLAEIDDVGELKCTLRAIALLHQTTKKPRSITEQQLLGDEVLLAALGSSEAVAAGIDAAVRRGTLVRGSGAIALNTADGRVAIQRATGDDNARPEPSAPGPRPNIFALYEDNVGALSPMIADELKQAEADYPADWIEEAFKEAVMANARSWRYVRAILERWSSEGRGGPRRTDDRGERGRSRGHIKEARPGPGSRY